MMKVQTIRNLQRQVLPILKKAGVLRSAVFGSFARGDHKKNSDIDFLIESEKVKSLFELVDLKLKLEEKLNKRVDLVSYKNVHPSLRKYIEADQIPIL